MIISVLNLKGGAGKTTIATNLAYALAESEEKVLLLDTDNQRSAMHWYSAREDADDSFSAVSITEPAALKKQLPMFKKQYDYVVVDGAPQTDVSNAICIILADVILIPLTPSPYDLWATQSILDRIAAAQEVNPQMQAFFILNRVNEQASLSQEIIDALKTFNIPVLNSKLKNRIVYADSATSGLSVLQARNKKAKDEFEKLFKELKTKIKKLK